MAERLGKMVTERMGEHKLDPDVRRDAFTDDTKDASRPVSVLLKVSEAGYVPAGVTVRATFSRKLYSAELPFSALKRLAADRKVVSVGTAKAVRIPEK